MAGPRRLALGVDIGLELLDPLELLERLLGVLYTTCEHAHLHLFEGIAAKVADSNLVDKVGPSVLRRDVVLLVIARSILNHLVRGAVLDRDLEEDRAQVGQGGA